MNKPTHKNPGLVVFLLLRAPVGAANVTVSHYGQTKYVQCVKKQGGKKVQRNVGKLGIML